MKHKNILLALLILLSPAAFAETPAQHDAMPMKPGMGKHHGMGNMTDDQREQHLIGMQEHILRMHDLSNQILAEKDSTKKEQLKKEQRELMKAHHMQMMERHKGAPAEPK